MFQVGDMIQGFEYNNAGEEVKVVGTYVCTTDDPEEMIQDIIIKTEDGRTVYIDEQVARPHTPEVKWALAKVMNSFADLGNEKFHTFAIKRDGEVVGQLKWTYRPKNAGGYAWQGKLFKSKKHFGMDVSFFDKNKQNVLKWFKEYK